MAFVILLGRAVATSSVSGFADGSVHVVVVAVKRGEYEAAVLCAYEHLAPLGFRLLEIERASVIPGWRAFLPTEQGRELRAAWRNEASVTVCSEGLLQQFDD